MILTCVASGSDGNCHVLDDDGHYLILDCGKKIPWMSVLGGINDNIRNTDAVLYSHRHFDHFGHETNFYRAGIPMFGVPEMGTHVTGLAEKAIVFLPGKWKVVPWMVPHTGQNGEIVPCYAYYIKSPSGHRMVYMTDFLYSPVTFKNLKVNTILIAANHDDDIESDGNSAKYEHVVSGHSKISTVVEILRQNMTSELRNVILCHLSAFNATPKDMLTRVYEAVGLDINVQISTPMTYFNLEEGR